MLTFDPQNKKHYGNKHNTTQNRNISVPNPQGDVKDDCGKKVEKFLKSQATKLTFQLS